MQGCGGVGHVGGGWIWSCRGILGVGVGHVGVGGSCRGGVRWGVSCRVEWVMQGWGGSCRGGVGWVM